MNERASEREMYLHNINATMPRTRGSKSEGKERSELGDAASSNIPSRKVSHFHAYAPYARYMHALASVIYTYI